MASIAAVAVWLYGYATTWDMLRDALDRDPLAARTTIALLSAAAGLVAGLVVYGVARIVIVLCREMRTIRIACRSALCGGGGACRWCGRSRGGGAPLEAGHP